MGRISEVNVGTNVIATFKGSVGTFTDADINKPVKLSAYDTVELCGDGDYIYGFIDSVEPHTEDGKSVLGIQIAGRRWVTMNGNYAVGDHIEAEAQDAVGVALTTTWGKCSTHVYDTTTAITLQADLLVKKWVVIYGSSTDETDALVELM